MKGIKSSQGSRLSNYQTVDDQDDDPHRYEPNPSDFPQLENEDPNQIEILFDPNEALAGFGNPSTNANPSAYNYQDDIEGERMGSGDSSGFYDHEDANEPPMAEPKNFSSAQTASEGPTDFEEVERGYGNQNDQNNDNEDYQFETKQVSMPTYSTQSHDAPTSYANYQISSAARAAYNKKKQQPPIRNKPVTNNVHSNKPDILGMHDDIGEVGEWVGKSANVNMRNEDSEEDDEEERNQSDDFEGVFEQAEPRKQLADKRGGEDEEEEERGERYQAADNLASLAEQSNKAMQKAQDSALRAARNKGPFMNNLKAKAKNLQIKAQDEATAVADGGIKLKNEMQNPTVFHENEAEEENEDLEDIDGAFSNFKAGVQQQRENVQSQKPKIPKLELGITGLKEKKAVQEKPASPPKHRLVEEEEQPQGLDELMKNRQSPIKQVQSPVADEWEAVSKVTAQQANQTVNKDDINLVTFTQAWDKARHFNLSEEKRKVQQELQVTQSFFQKLFGSCGGGGLSASLLDERDHVLALAKVPFREEEPLYFDILKTLYITLTGKKGSVPRFGPHWEVIGFQGRDPATDLRGVGVLGLLQLLAFLSSNEKQFKKMFEHSIHDKYNFPLSICGFSITQSVMEVVRAGKLNGLINSKRSVIEAMNEVYFATFYQLYSNYKTNSYTIQDYPKAKMAAISFLKSNPNALISEYKKSLSQDPL